ncbi:MAG: hypothetical protein N3D80_09050 [Ignavibacterium album]|jgi:hypothetical protein|uniref:hypothetical protein n=1 Tax=Ignavibacterium album TaxID=591197 RepID=UPI0026EC82C4|nr:hypothetical protein [Ignavibacterium album]MCX8106002.1 hypothetical protein [Ignavibacterium album]
MKSSVEILPLLLNPDCPHSRRKLIEVSYRIAQNYVSYNHRRVKKILISEEITPAELALEAISSLFEVDGNKRFTVINDALEKWLPPVSSEEEALFFLNKLVQKKTEQHISKLLRQADPFFSRLLDKINYHIKKNGYQKIHFLGNVYIVPGEFQKISGRVIKEEDFNNIPKSLFNLSSGLLANLFNYLEQETEFSKAIPLNLLIFRLKETESSLFEIDESTSDYIEKSNVDSIIQKALNSTLQKLNESYLQKNKIDKNELLLFEKTLRDIAFDLKDGGVNPGLHKYLFAHSPNISPELYSQRYRNILEYLFKLLKQNIAYELEE